jgi:hypothetical protein
MSTKVASSLSFSAVESDSPVTPELGGDCSALILGNVFKQVRVFVVGWIGGTLCADCLSDFQLRFGMHDKPHDVAAGASEPIEQKSIITRFEDGSESKQNH